MIPIEGGAIDVADTLETSLNALLEKFDILLESYFAQTPTSEIEYVWDVLYDIETTGKENSTAGWSINNDG